MLCLGFARLMNRVKGAIMKTAAVFAALLVWFGIQAAFAQTSAMEPSGVIPNSIPFKLLITEISTLGTDQEYIEIYNPNTEAVDLGDYYLTDAIYAPGDQFYWRIAEGNPNPNTVGGGAFSDFHSRFPDGFSIAAGDTFVISLPGSAVFIEYFGVNPDLEMYEDGAVADDVPDMRFIFGDDIDNSIINRTGSGGGQPSQPTLTNSAETVILYHWIQGEDKVTDIDVFAWKDPSSTTTSIFFNKTGMTVGSHTYLPEVGTNVFDAFGTQNDFGFSYHRTDATEGDQIPTGSNGVGGRDETSEDFNTTFAKMPYDPSVQGVVSGVEAEIASTNATLLGNFPNPFNPQTTIKFDLPKQTAVSLRVYDLAGSLVDVILDNEMVSQGRNDVVWRGRDLEDRVVPAGVYFYRLEAGQYSETKRMVLIK